MVTSSADAVAEVAFDDVGRAMIDAARRLVHLGDKGAAKSDVHLLHAATDREEWNAATDGAGAQRQCHGVAFLVVWLGLLRRWDAIP